MNLRRSSEVCVSLALARVTENVVRSCWVTGQRRFCGVVAPSSSVQRCPFVLSLIFRMDSIFAQYADDMQDVKQYNEQFYNESYQVLNGTPKTYMLPV